MTNELNLGTLKLPINSATKSFAILAKRGAGKSYTGAVMAEEFYKSGIPFVVFDPIDVWWGLRLNSDGKSKGLPIIVFGLQHSDIKLDKDMGRKIAQAVVKDNISCVISTFGMPKNQQRHLIAEFADELLNINNSPRHIFIEEAHEFLPQRVFGGLGVVFNAVSNLIVMGRNRGLGVTILNQRAATVNKDVLTQVDNLLAFRNIAPQDRKALKEWVEYHSAEGDFEKFMDSLPSLPTGEGWVWSPEHLNIFQKIKIRKRETFHPDREKLGDKFEMPQLEQIDIQSFIDKFNKETEKPLKVLKPKLVDTPYIESPKVDFNIQLNQLKNEYENRIMQKDLEIRKLNDLLNKVKRDLGVSDNNIVQNIPSSNLSMWLEKVGTGANRKALDFLSQNSNSSFTREQIALGIGGSKANVVNNIVPFLKRNLLVKEENGRIKLNPDL